MAVIVHKLNELSKAGFRLKDGKFSSRNGKLSTVLIDGANNFIIAHANPEVQELMGYVPDFNEVPIPNDLAILEISGSNGTFYQVGKDKGRSPFVPFSGTKPRMGEPGVISQPRLRAGDEISIKSKGIMQVVSANRTIIIVTSKELARDYAESKVATPVVSVDWADFNAIERKASS